MLLKGSDKFPSSHWQTCDRKMVLASECFVGLPRD